MKKGFKFQTCRNGHLYSTFGVIRPNGRAKGNQRCLKCVRDNWIRYKIKKVLGG